MLSYRISVKKYLHIKNPKISQNYCVDLGFSKLQGRLDVVESSKEKFIAEKSIFKNKGVSGLVVSKTDIPLLEPDRKAQQKDFDERIDIIPVADPNIFSMTQRVTLAQTELQLAMSNPQMHNLYMAYRKMYEAIGV